jgi:hypothetical protein
MREFWKNGCISNILNTIASTSFSIALFKDVLAHHSTDLRIETVPKRMKVQILRKISVP